jgi:predicted nuclease of restriction endonuclease-like RecB superfamily
VKRLRTMLPSELLAVWKRKGVIWPRYASLSDDNLEVAGRLIEVYKTHVGEKKSVLKGFADEMEDKGYDYRFVRGLSFLLDRRSRFKCGSDIDAVDVRRKLYHAAGKLGLPTTAEQRERMIEAVASELKIGAERVEEVFYADLETELILEEFEQLSPLELLQEYNLSLTQTLLFESTEVRFTSSGNWQVIFHSVKRLGLIYDVYQDGRFWVKVDGPASLFKLTRRYGTAIAKLLPVVVASPEYTVEAKILWKYSNEICDFKIESWKHRALLKRPQASALSFDSSVEEDFAARFEALKSEWLLRREPEPVLAGKQVIIPDFSLEREGVRIYLEIVGYWTVEYLLRKTEKLKKVDVDMIVLVDEGLACEKLSALEKHARLNVVYYRGKVPLAPILRYLEQAFQEVKAGQTGLVKDLPVVFTEPVVNYEEFAARIGVSSEAVKAALTEKPPPGYTVMSNEVVRKDVLELIQRRIGEQMGHRGRLCFSEAVRAIESEGVKDVNNTLATLGYKVVWHGISSDEAEVVKA